MLGFCESEYGLTICVIVGWAAQKKTKSVQNTQSEWIDCGFVDQHDGNVVFNWINTTALRTFEGFALRGERRFAGRANKDFEKIFVNHGDILLHSFRFVPGTSESV